MGLGATGSEDAWQRHAYISIESSATVKMQYEALTETIDIDMGERELDKIDLLNLGQIAKHGPVGICTVTFEGYPLQAGTADTSGGTKGTAKGGLAKGYWEAFANAPHSDTTNPLDLDMSVTLTRYRVAVLWTDEDITTGTTSAASNTTPSITGGATTANDHAGKMMKITSGDASGGYYMIVSHTNVSVYTLTTGDTPETDTGSATPSVTFEIYPTGSGACKLASKAKRFVIADCICTSCKTDYTDKILKQTLVFKGKVFDKSSNPLVKMESNNATVQLPALGNYSPGATYWS